MSICRSCKPVFSDWTDFAVTQGGAVTSSAVFAWFWRAGDLVVAEFDISIGSSGTATNSMRISLGNLPAVFETSYNGAVGTFLFVDSSAAEKTGTVVWDYSLGLFTFQENDKTGLLGVTSSVGLANGDRLTGALQYRTF